MRQSSSTYSGLQNNHNNLDVLKFITNAVKFWKLEFSSKYSSTNKLAKLSQQQQQRRSCNRHKKPCKYVENRCITCSTALTLRVLQTTLFVIFQLTELPVSVNGCSTRSRYDQKKLITSSRVPELRDCAEVYWSYCRNGGICKMTTDITQRAVPICSCPTGYRGRQCELINDPNIYFSRQQGHMEMAAMSGIMIAIICVILFVSFVLFFYKRYMKYGMQGNNSLRTFDALELSPRRNDHNDIEHFREKYKHLQRNESVNIQLTRITNYPTDVFEMFTMTGYRNAEYAQNHHLFNTETRNSRNISRRLEQQFNLARNME